MCPISYYTMIRKSKEKTYFRLQLVMYAEKHGVKPCARAFNTTPKTVRKWVKRYNLQGYKALENISKAPHNIPHKIKPELETQIIKHKKNLPSWGALRLKRDFKLPCSDKAISRVYRENNLTRIKRRKHQTKNDLREMKQAWRLFSHNGIDTKDLIDIPEYFLQMKLFNLPTVQYTYREVVSGLQFTGFACERSLINSKIFAQKIKQHLVNCNVNLNNSIWQSDNGSEFIGSWNARNKSIFTKIIEDNIPNCIHQTIPPGAHRWQADVETVHRLIEDEFYEVENFTSKEDFLRKITAYQYFFNATRPNSYKGGKTPLEIIQEREPTIDPKIVLLPPIFLDDEFEKLYTKLDPEKIATGGYHLPSYP